MRSEKRVRSYRARWVVPVSSPPIENGRVEVVDGRIAGVGEGRGPFGGELDLGDVVVLPGFVNAHTHLELTLCRGRVSCRGSFTDWVRDVVSLQRSGAAGEPGPAINEGVRQMLARGVTAVADIGSGRQAWERWCSHAGLLAVSGFLEVLGMGPRGRQEHDRSVGTAISICEEESLHQQYEQGWAAFSSFASTDLLSQGAASTRARIELGLSPHAPYSTDPGVYREAIAFCRRTGRPICTHLAETPDEGPFLLDGTGPFRDLLEEWGLWDGSFEPPGCSPVAYAQRLGLLDGRCLLAHVNYASDEDLDLLASGRASVVYCPRTHRFFGHEPHRYREMLARGINVCVGTDSLASSDSLSVLDELRFLHRTDRAIADPALFEMGTLAGARALGMDREIGSLEPGKRADLAVIPLEHIGTREPLADVLSSAELACRL